jgi:hypothetical protein
VRAIWCAAVRLVVFGSARGSVRQCPAVRVAVYSSVRGSLCEVYVRQCAAVCGSVRQCAAVCGSVCGCVRQWMRVAVCGSGWQRVTVRVAVSGSGCVAVCGSSVRGRVWESAWQCVALWAVVCAHAVRGAIVIYMSEFLLLLNNNSDIVACHTSTCVHVCCATIIQITTTAAPSRAVCMLRN